MSTNTKSVVKPSKDEVEKVKCAIRCIESAMKRNKLSLIHVHVAVNAMVKDRTVKVVLDMRSHGASIRRIAREIHMDDKRVSCIIKKYCRPSSPCKPCKPAKPSPCGCCSCKKPKKH